jgi:hypothetical protein
MCAPPERKKAGVHLRFCGWAHPAATRLGCAVRRPAGGARTRARNGNRSVRAAEMPVRRGLLTASPDVLFKVG